jgi:hypothetical protein
MLHSPKQTNVIFYLIQLHEQFLEFYGTAA